MDDLDLSAVSNFDVNRDKLLRHSSIISGFQHTMVLQKREKLTCMTFLCVIAHQEQNEAHTFLPSFDNSDGRLCQERLRSRNRATLVT